ncbi:oxidoreductase [Microlunatus endophyticus]|uniref:Oxidoreductase n=1 Tax=Microlunatus endophyticus TaxID=1716077 RepID=A0A917SGC3_9ACTN|nr:Gfo/Idh/MocA family oxidoreductase [Microlunatus endophyticus]GGL75656.1 oxidoreductase [Microlunatus endophyticus]
MAEHTLGYGVIGAGGISRFAHLPNLARNPRARLVAIADIDPAKARRAAEDFDIPYWYDDYHELLANPEVEAVSVTTWPAAHAEPVIAAAAAGKHVLCEKPIATSLEDADAMVEAADRAGVRFTMGYQHRFGTGLPLVKQLLGEGVIGRPMGMTQVGVGPSAHGVPWFLQKQYSGGGVLIDWGIYTAHTILWLMGPVASVYATSEIFRSEVMVRDQLVTGIDVEDTVMATMRFANGAMGSWYAAWAVAAAHGGMTLDGSDGSIITGRDNSGLSVFSNTFSEPAHLHGWRQLKTVEPVLADLHYRKLAHLIDSVLDDRPLQLTGADGRDALELVLAIYRSAETGRPVSLPLARSAVPQSV